jgi:SAM-dependent methyltransferase
MLEVMEVDSPITPNSYLLYECPQCSSRFFNHQEHDVSLAELYDDLAKHRAHFPVEFTPRPYWQKQKNILISLLGKKPESVLDVGARTGDFLLHFDKSVERTGVEVSNYFCDIAKKRGLTMHEDFLQNITFETKFDIVSSYAIMEHLKAPVNFLNTVQAIVKQEGILVIMVPTHQSLKARFLKEKWHMYSPPEHLNFYSRNKLDEYLLTKGFTLQKRYYSIGGMFKPFRNVPGLKKIHQKIPSLLDAIPLIKRIPVYDHMFSYYKRDHS